MWYTPWPSNISSSSFTALCWRQDNKLWNKASTALAISTCMAHGLDIASAGKKTNVWMWGKKSFSRPLITTRFQDANFFGKVMPNTWRPLGPPLGHLAISTPTILCAALSPKATKLSRKPDLGFRCATWQVVAPNVAERPWRRSEGKSWATATISNPRPNNNNVITIIITRFKDQPSVPSHLLCSFTAPTLQDFRQTAHTFEASDFKRRQRRRKPKTVAGGQYVASDCDISQWCQCLFRCQQPSPK